MDIMVAQFSVKDYDAWKATFDTGLDLRTEYGVRGHTIYRDTKDPNQITLYFECDSHDRVQELSRDPRLHELWRKGGVIGQPNTPRWVEKMDSMTYAQRRAA